MIDYEAITQKNERELGTKLRSRRTQVSLYADPTHFVYELLQNADDHGATEIWFKLLKDRLIVEHNATEKFTVRHIEAISSFEDSTSELELIKTGKFGLGFKSVFAFTSTPRVYCGNANFEIRDLYRLRGLDKPHNLTPSLTRFELPFNHIEHRPEFIREEHLKSPAAAFSVIQAKLEALEHIALLFTRNLASIQIEIDNLRYSLKRTRRRDGTIAINTQDGTSTFRLFERPIVWQSTTYRPVQIAIRLDDNGAPLPAYEHLVATFPTFVRTEMGIILNGPYRTTPARETVGENDPFNEFLVEQTAELLVDTVRKERDAERLDLKLLEILPIEPPRPDAIGLFHQIHERIRKMLVEEPILPGATSKYVAGKDSRIARGKYLLELFSDEQLTAVCDSDTAVYWLSSDITEKNTPTLYRALAGTSRNIYQTMSNGLVDGIVLRPEALLARLSVSFLSSQSTKWLCKLYSTLQKHASDDAKEVASQRPIVRLSDQRHVPLLTNGRPSAYLPTKSSSKYETVDAKVLRSSLAKEYFTTNGYREPDSSAEVFEKILPKYSKHEPSVSLSTHLLHLKKILAVLKDPKSSTHLLEELASKNIVLCVNAKSSAKRFCLPSEAYFRDKGLSSYFASNPDAWFVASDYGSDANGKSFHELFARIGVASVHPRELCRPGIYARHHHGWHERGIAGFHPDWNLDGLDFATENPTVQRAAYIWNNLLPRYKHRVLGKVQSSTRQDFPAQHTQVQIRVSPGGEALRHNAWIPTRKGEFVRGCEIGSTEFLSDLLERDDDILSLLDEGASAKKIEAAKTLGISTTDAAFINENKEAYDKWKEEVASRQANLDRLESTLSKERERRRQRLQKRKSIAPQRASLKKLRSVRAYSNSEIDLESLHTFYRNDDEDNKLFCQICLENMPFHKRRGDEYSECVTLFTKSWADKRKVMLKVMTPLNLILCPTCSSLYREYVHEDLSQQDAVLKQLVVGSKNEIIISCSRVNSFEFDRIVHFDPNHIADIRDCLQQD